jgi:hypothetical protein
LLTPLDQGLVPAAQTIFELLEFIPRASITVPASGAVFKMPRIVAQMSVLVLANTLASMKFDDPVTVVVEL